MYNAQAKIHHKNLTSETMVQALYEEIGKDDFTYNIMYNQDGRFTHFFFAHSILIMLTKNFSNIFVVNYTYKTNRSKIPLLRLLESHTLILLFILTLVEKKRRRNY